MCSKIQLVTIGAVLTLVCVLLAPTGNTTWLNLPNTRETIVDEPIFHGQVYIFETGINHDKQVMLVHGIGTNGIRDWTPVIPKLAEKFHVIAFDLPGFGKSTKSNELYTPENYAAFIKYVANKFTSGSFSLVGHSMGATISLRYAGMYPEDVERLVIADSPGVLHQLVYSRFLSRYGVQLIPGLIPNLDRETQTLAGKILETYVKSYLSDFLQRMSNLGNIESLVLNTPQIREKVLQGDPMKIAALAVAIDDFSNIIPLVKSPTLIIWGKNDDVAPLRTGKMLAANLPDARLVILENSGHVPMEDQPDKFNELIISHLAFSPKKLANLQSKNIYALKMKKNFPSKKNISLENKYNNVITGNFNRISIVNSEHVTIRNTRAREIIISNSQVDIENTHIFSKNIALTIRNSKVVMTGCHVEGDVAINTDKSYLDLAGVKLVGTTAAIQMVQSPGSTVSTDDPGTSIYFSVSNIQTPYKSGRLHGPVHMKPGKSL